MRKKFVITLWVILFLCISAVSLAFYAIWHGWIGYMPNLYQLENPVNKYASQAVSADGKLLGTWSYSRANRIFVGFDDLSPWLVKALVATEDERFYDHSGIDYRALARAVVKRGLLGQSNAGGGSTITSITSISCIMPWASRRHPAHTSTKNRRTSRFAKRRRL